MKFFPYFIFLLFSVNAMVAKTSADFDMKGWF